MGKKSNWKKIPTECVYKGKKYRILNIDLQGGLFTLQDLTAEKGEVQVLDNINMEECSRKPECESSPTGKHDYVLSADSFEQPYCQYCYKGS